MLDQISIDDFEKEDGLDTLIAFLDKHMKKDDLADSVEKFGEYQYFQRKNGMTISEYTVSFDSRYRTIEKLKMTLPQEILAFKLLSWLVGCFGFNGPLRQYFSLYRAVSQREGERGKKG